MSAPPVESIDKGKVRAETPEQTAELSSKRPREEDKEDKINEEETERPTMENRRDRLRDGVSNVKAVKGRDGRQGPVSRY